METESNSSTIAIFFYFLSDSYICQIEYEIKYSMNLLTITRICEHTYIRTYVLFANLIKSLRFKQIVKNEQNRVAYEITVVGMMMIVIIGYLDTNFMYYNMRMWNII